jgi:putative MATE family efflux protein
MSTLAPPLPATTGAVRGAALAATPASAAPAPSAPPSADVDAQRTAPAMSPRTQRLLQGAIVPTLLLMAWPNILVMTAQASTGLIETWWVSKLGTDALAGMALVFPGFMMMQMLSAGAIGGGIASAVARALGANRRADADALVLHAILINLGLGIATSVLFLAFGRPLYAAMGGQGGSLEAALAYSDVVFAGNVLVWLMNALASVIRGTGNMLVPSLAVCLGVVLLVPLSPLLIFGWGPVPALGIAGGGVAVLATTALIIAVLGWYILSGRCVVRLRRAALSRPMFADILRVGGVGAISTLQTTLTVALTTGIVGAQGGPDAVAGYGTGARLEYLLIPLVFGLGAPMVALVGTNIGAGQRERALRIALVGGALAFALTEAVGLAAAIWPEAWLGLFGHDPAMLEAGVAYLRVVGPVYGFFGLGLSLYFASQGAGRLAWPLLGGFLRLLIAVGGAWLALTLSGSLAWAFAALALALVVYGATVATAIASGVWFTER